MKKLIVVLVAAALVIGAVAAKGAPEAQTPEGKFEPDPERTITLVVPQGAGGGTDTQARQLVEAMKAVSGFENIIVENVTGGSTGIGTNQVIDSEPDGYTLLMYGTYVVCGTMTGYTDGYEGLDFIAGLTLEPFIIAVRDDAPYKTFDDLIKAAKADPGKLVLGNAGATATTGVVAYGLNIATDQAFNVTSFHGGAELIPAVIGGHANVGIFSQSEVLANRDSLRPLVFLGKSHSVIPEFASVPTLEEAGYGELNVPGGCFRGICATKGAPAEMESWLADVIDQAFHSDSFQGWVKKNGLLPQFTKLKDFEKYNQELIEAMKPIIKATGLASGKYAD